MRLEAILSTLIAITTIAAQSLDEVLSSYNDLSLFADRLEDLPDLLEDLRAASNITILAPNDGTMRALSNWTDSEVEAFFRYSILNSRMTWSGFDPFSWLIRTFLRGGAYTNLDSGQMVEVSSYDDAMKIWGGFSSYAIVTQQSSANIEYDAGILHIVEGRLVLPGSVSRAALHLNLTSFVEALDRVDLLDALEAQEEVTVFAFNNTAPPNAGSVEDNELDSILQLSIVPDRAIYSTNWNTTAFNLNGTTLDLSAQNGRYFVNDVPVLGLDIFLNNGVMHVLEGVLSPGGTGAGTSDRGDATRIQTPTIGPSPDEGSEDPLTSAFTDTPTELDNELPEPTDQDVHLLHAICTTAASTQDPPFKALFAAYDSIFAEEGVEHEHDGVVFRYLMRLGEQARSAIRVGKWHGYVYALRALLKTYEITLVDENEDEEAQEVKEEDVVSKRGYAQSNGYLDTRPQRRRGSFNDSNLEETWVSEQSRLLNVSPAPGPKYLAQPPKRGNQANNNRRARSTEGRRSGVRFAEPEVERAQFPPQQRSVHERRAGVPEVIFQPSTAELEAQAEAFYGTCDYRIARVNLYKWIDATLLTQQRNAQAEEKAAQCDRRTLLTTALSTLVEHARAIWQERRQAVLHEQWEVAAQRHYNLRLLPKAFTHWLNAARRGVYDTRKAQQWMMQLKYFRRWKQVTIENATKARSIVTRRLLRLWVRRTALQKIYVRKIEATREEMVQRWCLKKVHLGTVERRLGPKRDAKIMRTTMYTWRTKIWTIAENENEAAQHVRRDDAWKTLHKLQHAFAERLRLQAAAEQHHATKMKTKFLAALIAQGRLTPVATVVTLKCRLDLERRAFSAWSLQLRLSRQAIEVDKRRVLQAAWTKWNDALRCRALAQHINERVVLENLYRWVLQERLRLFTRTRESRLVQRALIFLRDHTRELHWHLDQACLRYQQGEERRILSAGMVRLNSALRRREDAERAAIEFANLRRLPTVLDTWREKASHAMILATKASRARYYLLGTRTLRDWHSKTTTHQDNRRREAYAHVRMRIKTRTAREALAHWRTQTARLHSLQTTATAVASTRQQDNRLDLLRTWHAKTQTLESLHTRAIALDEEKLVSAALTALTTSHSKLQTLEILAKSFLHNTNLALLASALRKLQWTTFTTARRTESAEALRKRNRELQVRELLRAWAAKTAAKTQPALDEAGVVDLPEPESPSLRPASRAAARSVSRDRFTSPGRRGRVGDRGEGSRDDRAGATSVATPSRSRTSSRFRALPTPRAGTPFALDTGYLVTTPAPLQSGAAGVEAGGITMEGLTPQITPFARKLRAGGVSSFDSAGGDVGGGVGGGVGEGAAATATPVVPPPSALKRSVFGRSVGIGGTGKSVRFASGGDGGGGRFGGSGRLGRSGGEGGSSLRFESAGVDGSRDGGG
ncbi:hypothetical protein MBLNU230_g7698t1 [Neophaeotheca triangularis]